MPPKTVNNYNKKPSETKEPPVVVSVSFPKGVYKRLLDMRTKEGFLNDQEVVRMATIELLKKGGY